MGNIDDLCNYIVKRNIKTESEVRTYLKKRINDDKIVDAVVDRLAERNIIKKEEPDPEIVTPKNDFIIPAYKKAVAQIFQLNRPMPRNKLKMKLSFDMHWFSPNDSGMFIDFCERDGLVEEKNGVIQPTFDAESIDIPYGWSIHKELNIKTGDELAKEQVKKKDREMEVAFVKKEKEVEFNAMLEEDGIVIDDDMISGSPIDFDDVEENMTVSGRMEFKRKIIKLIASEGIPSRTANGLFDYYELNYGIANVDMFIMNSVQNEHFNDENALKNVFKMLKAEQWGWENEA